MIQPLQDHESSRAAPLTLLRRTLVFNSAKTGHLQKCFSLYKERKKLFSLNLKLSGQCFLPLEILSENSVCYSFVVE